jgi:hypothetical protein
MSEPHSPPPAGSMILFDAAIAPLEPASYRIRARTDVTVDAEVKSLTAEQQFVVEAPRFAFGPQEIATVTPPAGAEGAFESSLPQVLLRRRTLPWERELDPANRIGTPQHAAGDPPSPGRPSWLALLVFEENECEILRDLPLSQVVPSAIRSRLRAPDDVRCDAVQVDRELAAAIVPSKEELALLAHVRWVNVDDRELAAGDSDGWFSVVAANRLPDPGATSWACLVSLEERDDLVQADPPPVRTPDAVTTVLDRETRGPSRAIAATFAAASERVAGPVTTRDVRLILLHAWQFTCQQGGTFRELVGALDVGVLGTPDASGRPEVTDTGHLPMTLRDRAGVDGATMFRGPLVPYPLSRDPLGPYHSADQARRVSPESGAEDISYAAAFELGRLLAASDPRLRQDLSRWRVAAYRQAATRAAEAQLQRGAEVPASLASRLQLAPAPVVAESILGHIAREAWTTRADGNELAAIRSASGLDAAVLAASWGLASADDARALLGPARMDGGDDAILPAPPPSEAAIATVEEAADDSDALAVLAQARAVFVATRRGGDQ